MVKYVWSYLILTFLEHEPPIQEVVSLGVIPRLIQFLSVHENPVSFHFGKVIDDEKQVLQFEAAWALTNIASGSTNHTLAVVEAGAIPPLVDLLQSPYTDVLEQAAWALGNIAGDNVACRDMLLSAGALIGLSSIEVVSVSSRYPV